MDQAMTHSRRDLGKMALAALSAKQLLAKPNSKFGGVQIGIIVSPVGLADLPLQADQLLQYLVRLGINAVELQDVRVESYAGAPTAVRRPATAGQEQARRQAAQQLSDWRLSASMDKYQALQRMYREAGVNIYAFRLAILDKEKSDAEFRLLLPYGASAWRGPYHNRTADRFRLHGSDWRFGREAQDDGGLPQSHAGQIQQLGYGTLAIEVQRNQFRCRSLRSGRQRITGAVSGEIS
jgi:hypothetical protein